MSSLQHRLFINALHSFEKFVKLFGKSAYFKLAPRLVEEIDLVYPAAVRNGEILFYCAGENVRLRARDVLTREPETIAWIERFEDGDTMLDIGANIGVFSLYAAKVKKCQVISIEPAPNNFFVLNKNISLNKLDGQFVQLPIALSQSSGLETIYMSGHGQKHGGTGNAVGSNIDNRGQEFEYACQYRTIVYSLDDLFERFALPFPRHLKLDIDSVQLPVLRGARKVLGDPRLKTALIEMPLNADDAKEAIELMISTGWELLSERTTTTNRLFRRP